MAVQPAKSSTTKRVAKGQVRPEKTRGSRKEEAKSSPSKEKQNTGAKERTQKAHAYALATPILVGGGGGGALLSSTAASQAAAQIKGIGDHMSDFLGLRSGEEKALSMASNETQEDKSPSAQDHQHERVSFHFHGDSKAELKVSGNGNKPSGSIHLKKQEPGEKWILDNVDPNVSANKIINDWLQLDTESNSLPQEAENFIRRLANGNVIHSNRIAPSNITVGEVNFNHYGDSESTQETQTTESQSNSKRRRFWSFLPE